MLAFVMSPTAGIHAFTTFQENCKSNLARKMYHRYSGGVVFREHGIKTGLCLHQNFKVSLMVVSEFLSIL